MVFVRDFSPVLAKHSKRFSLEDALSIGVDRMQRNFELLRRQVQSWRAEQLSAEAAKLTIYRAFIEGDLEVPRHLVPRVSRTLLQSGARGVLTQNHVEPVERIYLGVQGTRSDLAIPSDGKIGKRS